MHFKKALIFSLVSGSPKDEYRVAKNWTDDELIDKIVEKKDSRLFGVLYDRYSNKVYNKCISFTKNQNEAKDLVQDIFLKVFVKLHHYNKVKASFSTWLYVIVYNHCTNYVTRDKKRWQNTFKESSIKDYGDSGDVVELEELNGLNEEKFSKALLKLPPEDKALLLLRYQDDVPIKEIQELLSLNESAVKMRLNRAKKKVVKLYENSR